MKQRTIRLCRIAIFLTCICSSGFAFEEDAKAVALEFCALDGAAARLSSASPDSPQLWKLTMGVIEPPQEPIFVVSDYSAEVVKSLPSATSIKITYHVTGRLDSEEFGFSFARQSRVETIMFKLKRTSAGWRILRSSLSISPHVTELGIRNYFNGLIAESRVSEKQKENLRAILSQLRPVASR